MKRILFSLEKCPKCEAVQKELVGDTIIIVLPHNLEDWKEDEIAFAKKHNVLEDLKITAPILVYENGEKLIGQLKILRRLRNEKKI